MKLIDFLENFPDLNDIIDNEETKEDIGSFKVICISDYDGEEFNIREVEMRFLDKLVVIKLESV